MIFKGKIYVSEHVNIKMLMKQSKNIARLERNEWLILKVYHKYTLEVIIGNINRY